MRIAMFTETYRPNTDGVVSSIDRSKAALEERGHRVAVFAPGKERRTEGDVHWFRSMAFRAYPDYRMPVYRTEIGEIVDDLQPDVIHSHGTFFMGLKAVLAARRVEAPLVYTHHTHIHKARHYLGVRVPKRAFDRLVWTGLRWYLRRTDAVIAPSGAAAELLDDRANGDIDRLEVVPSGVDTARFRPDATTSLDLPDRPRVLTVGRVAEEKNVDEIVRTAVRRPELAFLVAGKGPYLDEVRTFAAEQDADNVTFLGYVADEELPGLYASADVFFTPSTFETQGLVVLEALASGTPVVAPREPVFEETVDEDSGVLCELDADAFAEAIDDALALDGDEVAPRETAAAYDEERCADRLEAVYREVATREARPNL